MESELSQEEVLRYSRHLMIPQVGLDGQKKLKQSAVLLVGTGGLGSPISMYLAAAGIGRLGLVDFDVVDSSNLQRQIVHGTSSLGIPKVESARNRLTDLNPYIQIDIFNEYLNAENIERIADGFDIVVDGTDNFSSRYLINDYCVFHKKPFVYGSIYRFEGQVSVFDVNQGPCYRCIFPTPPPPGLVPTCGEGGVFGILPGTIGTLQATQVIKYILGFNQEDNGSLFLYDALDLSLQKITLKKNPKCKICGENPEILSLQDTQTFCARHEAVENPLPEEWTITVQTLKQWMEKNKKFQLMDVRDKIEREIISLPGSISIPMEQIKQEIKNLDADTPKVIFCRNGIRSARVVRQLREMGLVDVYNLEGGTNAWVKNVDPSKYLY